MTKGDAILTLIEDDAKKTSSRTSYKRAMRCLSTLDLDVEDFNRVLRYLGYHDNENKPWPHYVKAGAQ